MPAEAATSRVRLGTILALLLLITIVPLGLFSGGLIYTSWQQQRDLVNRQNVERARSILVAIDQDVQSAITALNVLAKVETIQAEDLRTFYDLSKSVMPLYPAWQSVRLIDPAGRVLVDNSAPYGEKPPQQDDEWVRRVRESGRAALSPAGRDPVSGRTVVTIGVPVMRGDRLRFVLAARIFTSQFSDVLKRQKMPPGGVAALLDSNLTIMARTRGEDQFLGRSPTPTFVDSIRGQAEGSTRSTTLEGVRAYSAHSTSSVTGWVVGLAIPADEVDRPILRSLAALIAANAGILGTGLFLAIRVRRRIVRAQNTAVGAARALARGEPVEIRHSAVIEFNDLANGLRDAGAILTRRLHERDEAEEERARAGERLEEALIREHAARVAGERNEARLSVTLRSLGDAVITTDADGNVTMLNPVAQTLTGWPEDEAIGKYVDSVFQIVDEHSRRPKPGPRERIVNQAAHATPFGPHAVLMARDGRDIPINDSAAPIRGPDGSLLGIVVVFRDVSVDREVERQRAAALQREQAARRAAESLSRAKDEFVATVSHELRTPLNAIFGWVAMLKMGSLDAAGSAKALEVIDRNTRVQAQLIEDLLDMARVIRGTVRLEMQPVDLAAVLESALDAVKPAADARRVNLSVKAARGVALVSGDSSRLQQIFWNLLSNSIKFSQAGDEVHVMLEQEGNDAVLRVRDTGTGIDKTFLPYVFDRFRQETSDVTREHAGLGLGLSLVRHLTELHGGTVTAASDGKAHGATFTVRLPLLGAAVGDQAFVEERQADVTGAMESLQGLKVLAVDDDADARELIVTALYQSGAEAVSASSVQEAIALLESSSAEVVITDIAMPHATGFDLIRQIRQEPRWSMIPVIAVTAYSRAEDRAQALALGFNAHVGKPFSPRALIALVAELAKSRPDRAGADRNADVAVRPGAGL